MDRTIRTLLLAMIGALFLLTSTAFANDEIAKPTKTEAKARLSAGAGLFRAREFEKAIVEFKAGVVIEDAPIFHFNLGQSYRHLGQYKESIWHFERFLRNANPLPVKYKDAVETLIRDMKSEMERKAMTNPPTEPADGEPSREIVKPVVTPVAPVPLQDAPPWYADRLGWGLVGTGAIAGGVSIFLLVKAGSLTDEANMEPNQMRQEELHDQAGSRRLVGTIVGVVGGAALVTGIIKLAITPKERESANGVSLGITRHGISVMGRF